MQFKIHNQNSTPVAEIESKECIIKNIQDALDLMANADYQGARRIVTHESNFSTDLL